VAPRFAPGHSLHAAHCSAAAMKAQHLLYTSQLSVRRGSAGHDDYRDRLPTPLDDVVREYKDVVKVTTLLLGHSLPGRGAHVVRPPTAARRVDLWFVPVLGQAIQGARCAALLCRWPVLCCDASLTCAPACKIVKSAVHVPCCPSFRFLPWRWRGICFGRRECVRSSAGRAAPCVLRPDASPGLPQEVHGVLLVRL